MPGRHYPLEYKEQILELHRNGRSVASLARDFEPSAATIYQWIKDAEEGDAPTEETLSESEREELKRLRKQVAQLETEREILEKAAAWFAQKTVPKSSSGS